MESRRVLPLWLYGLAAMMLVLAVLVLNYNCGFEAPPPPDIHAAAQRGDLESVQQLLTSGADPNQKDHRGDNALSPAIRFGHRDVAEYLLAQGTSLNYTTNNGARGIVSELLYNDQAGLMQWACARGLRLSDDVLFVAVRSGRVRCVTWLLKENIPEANRYANDELLKDAWGNAEMVRVISQLKLPLGKASALVDGAYGRTMPTYQPGVLP